MTNSQDDPEPLDIYFSEQGTLSGYMYPFVWHAVDPIFPNEAEPASLANLLGFICVQADDRTLDGVVNRYHEITAEEGPHILHSSPPEVRIVNKLVWPLRYAKASYMCGDNLGVIAQCGVIAEMVAMLIFDMAEATLNGTPLDATAQRRLLGDSFEELRQQRRVDILRVYGLISDQQHEAFTVVRKARNEGLHVFSGSVPDSNKARNVFRRTAYLIHSVLGSDDPARPVKLRADLERFMVRNGCPAPLEPPPALQAQMYPRVPRS